MRRYTAAAAAVLVLLLTASAMANSYSTPNIDGHVEFGETDNDWDTDERAGLDPRNDCRYYPDQGDLRDLWVTWDETNLYFGVRTTNGPLNNGYVLYIDTDAQAGITGATDFTSADFYPRNITFSTMGVDAIFGVWNLLTDPAFRGFRHCTEDVSVMPDIEGAYAAVNPGVRNYEGAIPWEGLYGMGPGQVPPGTVLRFVTVVVGGDGTGAFDALPTSSTGYESNPSTPDGATTQLDRYVEIPLDVNGDGVPDRNYPPGGSISGTVTLGDPTDNETVVRVAAYQNGQEVWFDKTPAGGGEYQIERLADGVYDLVTEAFSYIPATIEGVVVADTMDTPGVDFALTRVTGRIEGEVAITGGPPVDVTVGIYSADTGELGGEGEVVIEGGSGAFSIGMVPDGQWLVLAEGKGYVQADSMATISGGDTTSVGLLELPVVVATGYGFSDADGNNIFGAGTTVSLPADTIYYYAHAWLEPRDDDGRIAYWDLTAQNNILLSATKLDPSYPTLGNIIFADPDEIPLPYSLATSALFDDGRAHFLVSGDAVEVVRVLAQKVTLQGVLDVGIDPPAPTRLTLSTNAATIAAGEGVAHITGQLVDASGNGSNVPGVIANMTSGGVGGSFSLSTPMTESDGRFEIDFSGIAAGTALISATIGPSSPYPNLEVDTLAIELTPGEAAF
ncbi:MAG TPA: carboxypeptidase-like regulatory domain-containing protein, partial [bacterium]|nr:carboxypeptidase-like regulatory domain-containing protein [bacterium]